jgi:hypothetical protein
MWHNGESHNSILFTKCHQGDNKEHGPGTHGRYERRTRRVILENVKGVDYLRDLGVGMNIILKWI